MLALFAVHSSNRFVHVTEVERGLTCDCRCAVCGEPVIALQGDVREHHFAHNSNTQPCASSYESDLHRFAKRVIIEAHGLVVPVNKAAVHALGLADGDGQRILWACTGVEEEVVIGNRRPDLQAVTTAGASVTIEIAYSSFCDVEKRQDYEAMCLPAMEIDLRAFTPTVFDVARVKHALLEDVASKSCSGLSAWRLSSKAQSRRSLRHRRPRRSASFCRRRLSRSAVAGSQSRSCPAATSPSKPYATTPTWSLWCALSRASTLGSTAEPTPAG